MNAVPVIEDVKSNNHAFLALPFKTWTADEILDYFQTRVNVHYFAIADANEVEREKIDGILANRFEFNGETFQFGDQVDWLNNPSRDIEWSIMLHKFYFAVGLGLAYRDTGDARYVNKWLALTDAWIQEVPVDHLSADVTGRRVQNWIFAHYYFITECRSQAVTAEFYLRFLQAIHEQVDFLCRNLTPARNHRTLELYTIFLAAVVFPELQGARQWLEFSIQELLTNSLTDILPDGVHCELSTDYHHIVLRNFLAVKRLAVLNGIELPATFDRQVNKALTFSVYAHKPDGTIPSLSDGDTGSFVNLLQQGYEIYGDETYRYAATAGQSGSMPEHRCKAFNDGGYYVMRSGWGGHGQPYTDERYLIFDCGPVGAGNHGHLDLLSFEMAAYGKSLIVDPGRYTYDESGEINWRVLFRGTGYHNTVLVDGMNQCRYEFHKKKFKITGEHPRFELKAFTSGRHFDYLHGKATSREYPVSHERKIIFVGGEYWLVCDLLTANENHRYDVLFHLSTEAYRQANIVQENANVVVSSPNLLIAQMQDAATTVTIEEGFISPSYGVRHPAPVVKFSRNDSSYAFYTVIYPYKTVQPQLCLAEKVCFKNSVRCATATANSLEITIKADGKVWQDRIFFAHREGEYSVGGNLMTAPVQVERQHLILPI